MKAFQNEVFSSRARLTLLLCVIQTQLVDYNAEVGFPIFTMNDQYANDIGHKLMMKSDVDLILIRQKSFFMKMTV